MTKTDPRKVIPILAASGSGEDGAQFVSMYQKQATIYPRAVKGWFATWRWAFVWLTQLLFYGLPWLQWSGRQAVLFDLDAQRFFVFGLLLCRRRSKSEPPRRPNIEPGVEADFERVGCG